VRKSRRGGGDWLPGTILAEVVRATMSWRGEAKVQSAESNKNPTRGRVAASRIWSHENLWGDVRRGGVGVRNGSRGIFKSWSKVQTRAVPEEVKRTERMAGTEMNKNGATPTRPALDVRATMIDVKETGGVREEGGR
jgi:hypothetical protein